VPIGQQVGDLMEGEPVAQQRVVLYQQQPVGQPEREREQPYRGQPAAEGRSQ